MKHSTQELKEIIDNAPEGATHYTIEFKAYIARRGEFGELMFYLNNQWNVFSYAFDSLTRSLSDIKEIIELRERLGE